jgi:hypothetical protein
MTHGDPASAVIARLESKGFGPKSAGEGRWKSRCPAHDGDGRSLSINRGDDGRALLKCHAHDCAAEDIVQRIGLSMSDLFMPGNGEPTRLNRKAASTGTSKRAPRVFDTPEAALASQRLGTPTAIWTYHERDGTEALRVARFESADGKAYRPIHASPRGWVVADPPGPLPLYHLPELADAATVFVTEGEKAADLVRGLGLTATTSAHGAKAAGKSDWSPLAGRVVNILPDHDAPGEGYANDVLDALASLQPRPTVRIVRLPDLWKTAASIPAGGDIAEWFEVGVPEGWDAEQCRAELERVSLAAPEEDLDARPEAGADSKAARRRRFKLTCAALVLCLLVEWIWRGRVPRGMLTVFAGDPKLGKSLTTIGMAAAVSRGVALPGDESPDSPGSVIILCAEDDVARTIVPRLKAAGADLNRVHILEAVFLADGTEAWPSLNRDLDAIEQAAASVEDCRLIIIDPVSAFMGEIDDHKNTELRGVLSRVKAFAERTNAAVVLVTHLSKGGGTNPKHRIIGSIAYLGSARASFLFVKDWNDPTGRRVLMCENGCNLVASVPTLAYVIADEGEGPVVEWAEEPVDISAADALAAESVDPRERNERATCDKWLREMLANGRKLQRVILEAGRDAGFAKGALNGAKRRIGAKTERDGFGPGSKCYWTLEMVASDDFKPPP